MAFWAAFGMQRSAIDVDGDAIRLDVRYNTAWGPSKIPDYLRKANPYGGDSVVDCSLRVALRKLDKMPFICPFDAGDVAVQPWPTRLLRGLVRFATPRAVAKAAPGKTFWQGLWSICCRGEHAALVDF